MPSCLPALLTFQLCDLGQVTSPLGASAFSLAKWRCSFQLASGWAQWVLVRGGGPRPHLPSPYSGATPPAGVKGEWGGAPHPSSFWSGSGPLEGGGGRAGGLWGELALLLLDYLICKQ